MLYNKPSPNLLAQKDKHLFLPCTSVGWLPLSWVGLDTGHQVRLQVGISHVICHVSNFLQQQLFRASSSHGGLQTSSVQPNHSNALKSLFVTFYYLKCVTWPSLKSVESEKSAPCQSREEVKWIYIHIYFIKYLANETQVKIWEIL